MEFGEDMESHPAPYDLQLFTRVHGGRFELIELNKTFDMAKSIFGQLQHCKCIAMNRSESTLYIAQAFSIQRIEEPGKQYVS